MSPGFPLLFYFGPRNRSGSPLHGDIILVYSVLIPQSFFVFHDLDTLEEFWSVSFVDCSPNWICLIFCHDYICVMHLTGIQQKWRFALFSAICRGYMISICFITGDINLEHLDKVISATFFYCKFMFPFLTNKCLVGRYCEAMQMCCFTWCFLPLILDSIIRSCLRILIAVLFV